jgi:protocatechuate 3,4-dioxygenase beta subunit
VRILLLSLLASCWTAAPPPIANTTRTTPPTTNTVALTGTITDPKAHEPLVGVTVVINPTERFANKERDGEDDYATAISDPNGRYTFNAIKPGRYDVRIYYADISVHRVVDVRGPSTTIDQQIDAGQANDGNMLECTSADVKSCK